jgi:hypothetical protein
MADTDEGLLAVQQFLNYNKYIIKNMAWKHSKLRTVIGKQQFRHATKEQC